MKKKHRNIIDLSKANQQDLFALAKAVMQVSNIMQAQGYKLQLRKSKKNVKDLVATISHTSSQSQTVIINR